ncbi:hypothetical protein Tco_0784970 [Tanacetum coccineum]
MPTTKSVPKVEIIESSSRPQLTITVIDITPPEQSNPEEKHEDPSFTTPKLDRGKGKARDTNESLRKLSKDGNVDSSKELDVGLVVTESNETESERHVLSNRSEKDTHAKDADINSVNDKQPMA